jgi:hypothetical protein
MHVCFCAHRSFPFPELGSCITHNVIYQSKLLRDSTGLDDFFCSHRIEQEDGIHTPSLDLPFKIVTSPFSLVKKLNLCASYFPQFAGARFRGRLGGTRLAPRLHFRVG